MDIGTCRKLGTRSVRQERLRHAAAPRRDQSDKALLAGHSTNSFVRSGGIDKPGPLGSADCLVAASMCARTRSIDVALPS
jgi:hypothetical protein